MRVAIIGQGPRGIQALFALAESVRSRGEAETSLDVVCFDPQPPGHGAAYAVDQPDCLRLNVRPDILDLPGCPTFVEWLSARGLPTSDTSRSHVGVYLDEMRAELLADLPVGMHVTTHRARVNGLTRTGARWMLRLDDASTRALRDGAPSHGLACDAAASFDEDALRVGATSHEETTLSGSSFDRPSGSIGDALDASSDAVTRNAGPAFGAFDEVLLCVGHAKPRHVGDGLTAGTHDREGATPPDDGSVASDHTRDVRVVAPVYPTARSLTVERVPAGSRVVVRGAALTFIDVALVLGSARDERERPTVVIPTSRSGLLMNTKPLPRFDAAAESALAADAARFIEPGPSGVLAAPRALAAALLATLHGGSWPGAGPRVDAVIAAVLDEPAGSTALPHEPRAVGARDRLAASIALAAPAGARCDDPTDHVGAAAVGESSRRPCAAPDQMPAADIPAECEIEWALGRAWALVYPQTVEAVSWFDGATPSEWAEFQRQSARYERLTFGPTLPQAKRLLALCDAGFIDTSWLDRCHTLDAESRSRWGDFADVVVDAVLAPAGIDGNERPLVASLLADGHVTGTCDGRRGLLVDDAAQCLDTRGRPTPGLSAVGRISEDVVVGHDTLNRHAHPHLTRWARRIGEHL